jgi:hypothetical protein
MKTMANERILELIRKYDNKLLNDPRILIGRNNEERQMDHNIVMDGLLREISDDLAALYEEEINGTKET